MSLREAAELAIEALQEARSVFNGEGDTIGGCGWCHAPSYGPCEPHCEKDRAVKALRAALAEDAMQRLTDVQQEMESVTDCHDLKKARATVIENLLAHLGITSANSDVNLVYLHKQLDEFLAASISCNKDGEKLSLPLEEVEECGYPNCLTTNGCEKQCPAFPRCEGDHLCDATKMIEPVAYVTGFSKGYAVVQPVDRSLLMPVGMALYRSPPTINEMETVEPVAYSYPDARGRTVLVSTNTAPYEDAKPFYTAPPKREPLTEDQLIEAYCCVNDQEWAIGGMTDARIFARAIERAHGIGGEE